MVKLNKLIGRNEDKDSLRDFILRWEELPGADNNKSDARRKRKQNENSIRR